MKPWMSGSPSSCCAQAEEPLKETKPAASVMKQPHAQENSAAVQPVKAAAAEVSGLDGEEETWSDKCSELNDSHW